MNNNTHYRPDIDGLRTLAVLSVMLYHLSATLIPGGFVGVDVFFVISGFVVTASMARDNPRNFAHFVSAFYARRLARILPALVLVLATSSLMATMFIPSAWLSHTSQDTGKAAYFGFSNWILQRNTDVYFSPRSEFNPYTHTWSLGVEEQFYLIAPLLIFLWRCKLSGATLTLATLTTLSFTGCIWASLSMPADAFYFIGFRFWELGAGALLYILTQQSQNTRSATLSSTGAWLGISLLVVAFALANPTQFPLPWAILPVAGTALIIGGAQISPTDKVRSLLAAPSMVWIGKRSYSLYLWHWPVYVLLRWTVGLESSLQQITALMLTITLASASYRYVEQPLRHPIWLSNRPTWLWICCFASIPALGYAFTSHIFAHGKRYSLSTVTRHVDEWYAAGVMPGQTPDSRICTTELSITAAFGGEITLFNPKNCRKPGPGHNLFVLGDSHAGHLAPSLERLSAETGINIRSYALAGCNFLDLKSPMDNKRAATCIEFNQSVISEITQIAKPDDIVLLSSLRMQRYGDQWASFDIPDMYEMMHGRDASKLRQAATEDAKNWLAPLSKKGLKIIFVQPTPIFKAPAFRCSDWFNRNNPVCVGKNQQPRAELEKLRAPIIKQMQEIEASVPGVHLWDLFPILCPSEVCTTSKDGKSMFFDGDHLSMHGNKLIYPSLKSLVIQ